MCTTSSLPRCCDYAPKGYAMDKDRVEGLAKKVSESIKEAIGKITGDSMTQAKGIAEKAARDLAKE